ncbi:GDP dissociation inhibitor [Xylariaceae sp. FL0804]|nr:GDP dissociation inhibitor [Xylariaceae sp. FL0804]
MMDSLGDEVWDAVICGTGLQQSLLALALSRSKKRILHLDPNDFYGEHEAALSLQEAESWAEAHAGDDSPQQAASAVNLQTQQGGSSEEQQRLSDLSPVRRSSIFSHATTSKHAEAESHGLSFPRAYTLALAPQIIHTRSKLLSQLVSAKATGQLEFLAVGSFYVYDDTSDAKLARIPSSREDVFSTRAIPARSKRSLMKFLKFVLDYDSEEQRPTWQEHAEEPLSRFLQTEFKLDDHLQKYILALTLTLDTKVTVRHGLAILHRHLTSTGLLGPGFCAVYPKWGGISEIVQEGCRAQAVGGGIYMLDTRMEVDNDSDGDGIALNLSKGLSIRAQNLVSARLDAAVEMHTIKRLVAVINSPLQSLFEVVVEGAPTPAVAVVAFPSTAGDTAGVADEPVYAMVHSSETGECPSGQSVIYLTTLAAHDSTLRLETALDRLLSAAVPSTAEKPLCLYKLCYEQSVSDHPTSGVAERRGNASVFAFPPPSLSLSFEDDCLSPVEAAWRMVMGDDAAESEYMVFPDREGVGDEDDD